MKTSTADRFAALTSEQRVALMRRLVQAAPARPDPGCGAGSRPGWPRAAQSRSGRSMGLRVPLS